MACIVDPDLSVAINWTLLKSGTNDFKTHCVLVPASACSMPRLYQNFCWIIQWILMYKNWVVNKNCLFAMQSLRSRMAERIYFGKLPNNNYSL